MVETDYLSMFKAVDVTTSSNFHEGVSLTNKDEW